MLSDLCVSLGPMRSLSSTVVSSPIYRGTGPLPKYQAGREPTMAGKFEGGQLVQAILTKAVFACEKLWGDAVLGSTMTSALPSSGLVSLHQYGNLCLMPRDSSPMLASLASKRKRGHCARWRPPGSSRHGLRHTNLTRCLLF